MEYPKWKADVPSLPHSLYSAPLEELVKFYGEHIRRDIERGRLHPPDFWVIARLFLISGMQTYAAICILLAGNRPKPLLLQAAILNRSLLETLGNVMAICEAPKQRTKILLREAFRNQAETLQKNTQRFGSEEKWKDYLTKHSEGLELFAKEMRVSRKYIKDPKAIREQWPLPGKMIYGNQGRKLPPFLHGSRLRAFREIYESHYGSQSEQAHQRMAALGVAQIVDNPETQWNPGHGESNIASTAILFLTCVISELEHKGRFAPHPRLRELWGYLRDLDDEAKDLWLIRYKATMNRKI